MDYQCTLSKYEFDTTTINVVELHVGGAPQYRRFSERDLGENIDWKLFQSLCKNFVEQ